MSDEIITTQFIGEHTVEYRRGQRFAMFNAYLKWWSLYSGPGHWGEMYSETDETEGIVIDFLMQSKEQK
jgi:hypothetical protein